MAIRSGQRGVLVDIMGRITPFALTGLGLEETFGVSLGERGSKQRGWTRLSFRCVVQDPWAGDNDGDFVVVGMKSSSQ
jgi:hypothetical protein